MTANSLLASEARVLRLRLEFGLATLEEIERWAEAMLVADIETPYEVVELAMARSIGVKETVRSLGVVGGEVIDATDVMLALAPINLDNFTPRQVDALFVQIAGWASSFGGQSTPESNLLVDAYRAGDDLCHALNGDDVSIEKAMQSARVYFKQVAEMAASIRESNGTTA